MPKLNPGLEGLWDEQLSAEENIYYFALMHEKDVARASLTAYKL